MYLCIDTGLNLAVVGKIVADYAIQVMGGAGYCREYPVERLWRDAKLLEVSPTDEALIAMLSVGFGRLAAALWRRTRRTWCAT